MVEIDKHIREACEELEAFANEVDQYPSSDNGASFLTNYRLPRLTQRELGNFPRLLAVSLGLRFTDPNDTDAANLIREIPERLQQLRAQVLPHVFNVQSGERPICIDAYINTFVGIRVALFGFLDWQHIDDPQILPSPLADRVKEASGRLKELEPQLDRLDSKVAAIENAHAAAEKVGHDLAVIAEAHEDLLEAVGQSKYDASVVSKITSDAEEIFGVLKAREMAIDAILQKAEDALRASTTVGLAGAFQGRANDLDKLNKVWLIVLIAALLCVGYIGYQRVAELSPLLKGANPELGTVFTQLFLSLASVGAPIWLAWLATKQINQVFKLMEDYSFKSTVARAYEGYRKEAANVSPALSERLFESALARFDETPLRWTEKSNPGSPGHELLRELRETANSLAGSAKAVVTPKKPNASDPTD